MALPQMEVVNSCKVNTLQKRIAPRFQKEVRNFVPKMDSIVTCIVKVHFPNRSTPTPEFLTPLRESARSKCAFAFFNRAKCRGRDMGLIFI